MIFKQFTTLFCFCLCLALSLNAQDKVLNYQRLHIAFTANGTTKAKVTKLADLKVANFDVEDYLQKNISKGHISITGTIITDLEITKFRFDSNNLPKGIDCQNFCSKLIKEEKKPILGVSVDHTDDFEGVWIKRSLDGTAAQNIGLSYGDVITYIDEAPINSGCDLRTTIQQYEVGEEINVQFERDGNRLQAPAVLSYQTVKEISWQPCCNTQQTPTIQQPTFADHHLKLFPNPTNGLTQVIFTSTDKGDFQMNVTDVSGRMIFEEKITNFDGFYKKHLNLSDQAAGIYFLNVVQGQQIQTEKIVLQKE